MSSAGTLTHAFVRHDSMPSSASCTPFGAFEQVPAETARRTPRGAGTAPTGSEGVVVALPSSGTRSQPSRKSIGLSMSGFQTGAAWRRRLDPARRAARRPREPRVPSTCSVEQVVAPDADAPGRVELGDDAALELERGVGGVVGRARVGLARLVPPPVDVRGAAGTRQRLHRAEEVVEHVAPVAEHVDDDAAAVFLAVVPGRPLRGHRVALEHPVAELAAHRQDVAEEAACRSACLSFSSPGSQSLSCTTPCLTPASSARRYSSRASAAVGGRGLLAVDVLARPRWPCVDARRRGGRWSGRRSRPRRRGSARAGVQVGGPRRAAGARRQRLELVRVAADQERIGHDARRRPAAGRRPLRGWPRSTASGAGWCPCAR